MPSDRIALRIDQVPVFTSCDIHGRGRRRVTNKRGVRISGVWCYKSTCECPSSQLSAFFGIKETIMPSRMGTNYNSGRFL